MLSEKEFGTLFSFTGPGLKPSCYNKKWKIVLFIELITIIFTSFLHQACDPDISPNINHLLQIACTIHQSLELTTSKQTVLWRHHENGNTVTLGYDGHLLQNACWLRCSGSAFWRKLLLKNASCWSRLWRNTNAVYFYHSFINANLHLCYAVFSYIFMQKECHFHYKKWHIKTRWLGLKMAGIAFPRTWNFKTLKPKPWIRPRLPVRCQKYNCHKWQDSNYWAYEKDASWCFSEFCWL